MTDGLARVREHYARQGVEIASDPVKAVRQLASEIVRLRPAAENGETYRRELIESALEAGVRAQGNAFPKERYRGILSRLEVSQIEAMRDDFNRQGDRLFSGGRRTWEQASPEGPRPRSRRRGPVGI